MKQPQIVISRAPGRINLIGEHTDYNQGYVLPAAIDKEVVFELSLNGTANQINLFDSARNGEHRFTLNKFEPSKENQWANYLMGVVAQFQKLGASLKGFDAQFVGNVPIGSGMSSSAALECSFAIGLNQLFELKLDKWQLIKAAMYAEHEFVGVKCGIMDQFASVIGKKDHAMLLDCRSLEFEYVPLDLGDYSIVLIDSNVKHSLATSAYNQRREECEEATALFSKWTSIEKASLRDVDTTLLDKYADKLDKILLQRSRHVITENERVLQSVQALKNGNIEALGKYMYASHESLCRDYEVSCTELDDLVDFTKDKPYIVGSRMMGGGFGGCTINLVKADKVDEFINAISETYLATHQLSPNAYRVKVGGGASINE